MQKTPLENSNWANQRKKQFNLASNNLEHKFSFQSTGGGSSGTKIKSASQVTPPTIAKYL